MSASSYIYPTSYIYPHCHRALGLGGPEGWHLLPLLRAPFEKNQRGLAP